MASGWQGRVMWMLLLFLLVCHASPDIILSTPKDPLSVWLGSSVILPCSVTTPSTESLEVRWHRPEKFKTPVLLYQNQQIQKQPADPQYRGRVSLIGDLNQGNVSMKLENATMADTGEFVCFVASKTTYGQASLQVIVKVMGSPPVLSVTGGGSGQVNVTCASDGWSPQPSLTWRTQEGTNPPSQSDSATDAQGFVTLTSSLLLSSSDSKWLSCSVGLSEQDRKESRIFLYTFVTDSGSWKGAFITALVLLLLSLMALVFLVVLLCRKVSEQPREREREMMLEMDISNLELVSEGDQRCNIGEELTLSCHLSPTTNAVAMDIRWFKDTDCIYLYEKGDVTAGSGYDGRVSLCREELRDGSVTLTLRNIQQADAGNYACQVISGGCIECTFRMNYSPYTEDYKFVIYPTQAKDVLSEEDREKMEASAQELGSKKMHYLCCV